MSGRLSGWLSVNADIIVAMTQREPSPHPCATTALPLLADPSRYVACRWDLTTDAGMRAYWLGLFRRHWPTMLDHARQEARERGVGDADLTHRLAQADAAFRGWLDAVEREPGRFGRLDVLRICEARQAAVDQVKLFDPYRLAKGTENRQAMKLYAGRVKELDAMPSEARAAAVMEGVFAGNIFDLGAVSTIAMFEKDQVDFHAVRSKLKPRPWFDDDLDAWLERLAAHAAGRRIRSAVVFVDNAGPDILLGMLPLARDLLQRGIDVLLTANSTPALNDVTHDELAALVEQVARQDAVVGEALAAERMALVASGNGQPLIDLSRVSGELAAAVERRGCDLVVLEGMGRAIESNYDAALSCDCLKLAMIKDEGVAEAMGASTFDLVCRFEPADG